MAQVVRNRTNLKLRHVYYKETEVNVETDKCDQ